MLLRFHTQTCGCTLTAQQPYNNVVRVALQALAAVLGGTQSLHTNSFDEALGLPTEHAATLALRTQQIIAEESGVTATADPLGGSYFVEALTDGVEHEARRWMERVAERGGAVAATESGLHRRGDCRARLPAGDGAGARRAGRRRRQPLSGAGGDRGADPPARSRRRDGSRRRACGSIARAATSSPAIPRSVSCAPPRRATRNCSARCAPPCSRARRSARSARRSVGSGAPIARRGRCREPHPLPLSIAMERGDGKRDRKYDDTPRHMTRIAPLRCGRG